MIPGYGTGKEAGQSVKTKNKEMKANRVKISKGEQVLYVINIILITLAMLICVYPFYYMVIYSLSDTSKALSGIYLLPKGFTTYAYQWIFKNSDFGHAFLISGSRR